MVDQPLVSVVINNYNYGRFLAEAIDSALAQTYPKVEVIVVDDGSTDHSLEVIACYGSRIKPLLRQRGKNDSNNRKQAAVLNAGAELSSGEIIIFLDADDYLFPGAVEKVMSVWTPNVSKVPYKLQNVDATGKPLGFVTPSGALSSGDVRSLLLRGEFQVHPPTSGLAFSRQALFQVLPIPVAELQTLSSDAYLAALVPFYGPVVSIEEPLGVYRLHGNNAYLLLKEVSFEWASARVSDLLEKAAFVHRKAAQLGHPVQKSNRQSFECILYQLSSVRLASKDHPPKNLTNLVYRGLRSLWRDRRVSWRKALVLSAWLLYVAAMPQTHAKRAIDWLFVPQSRPWLIKKLREVKGTA